MVVGLRVLDGLGVWVSGVRIRSSMLGYSFFRVPLSLGFRVIGFGVYGLGFGLWGYREGGGETRNHASRRPKIPKAITPKP